MKIHPDKTASRAVDACNGVFPTAKNDYDSGFQAGHEAALAAAIEAVDSVDALTMELLAAVAGMLDIVGDSLGVEGYYNGGGVAKWDVFEEVGAARMAVSKATGIQY